jgi:hypothetical protein
VSRGFFRDSSFRPQLPERTASVTSAFSPQVANKDGSTPPSTRGRFAESRFQPQPAPPLAQQLPQPVLAPPRQLAPPTEYTRAADESVADFLVETDSTGDQRTAADPLTRFFAEVRKDHGAEIAAEWEAKVRANPVALAELLKQPTIPPKDDWERRYRTGREILWRINRAKSQLRLFGWKRLSKADEAIVNSLPAGDKDQVLKESKNGKRSMKNICKTPCSAAILSQRLNF